MATSLDFALFVCEQIARPSEVRYKKMFGEYMIYLNDKPVLLLCDNTVFVKKLDCLTHLLKNAPSGIPYRGAKEYYILDVENQSLTAEVLAVLEEITLIPKPKKPKNGN